ncbi:MAG TPA: alanine racemase [Eubacteriaceae bacterium]|nr:alanine racemase [Eubacteriaceae bacterium]
MKKKWRHRPTWVEIDLDAIRENIIKIKELCGEQTEIMGIVKADGYGHGSIQVSKILIEEGVRYLAVSSLDEGIVLRKAGIEYPILILGYTPEEQLGDTIEWNIIQTVYNLDTARILDKQGEKHNKKVKVHIKIDTGMGRLGFRGKEQIINAILEISKMENIEIEGLYTHYSVSDKKDKKYTREQLNKFLDISRILEDKNIHIPLKHTANSAAVIDMGNTYFDLIRPGIIIYGLYPSDEVIKVNLSLKPAMAFKTRIAHIKSVGKNSSISYGRKYITSEEKLIATLPVGYADGYSRMLSGRAKVLIHGKKAPIIGSICMDQCMVDISEIPDAKIGDEVVLFGPDLPAEELAEKIGTINYEIICMVNKRVPRVYIQNNKIKLIKNALLDQC